MAGSGGTRASMEHSLHSERVTRDRERQRHGVPDGEREVPEIASDAAIPVACEIGNDQLQVADTRPILTDPPTDLLRVVETRDADTEERADAGDPGRGERIPPSNQDRR